MPKFNGKLMFDVRIEEQDSQEKVDAIGDAIVKAVNAINGVDSTEQVDTDIDETDDEEDGDLKDE